MNLDGTKNPHLFIVYHGNRYRVTIGDYKLTNEWGGMTLISAIAGIKTIIKTTTKTLKQTTPPQVIHLLIYTNAPAELMCLVSWASWPQGK